MDIDSPELDAVHQWRMEELKRRQEMEQQLASLEAQVRQHLTKEALQRFANIEVAYPEKASRLVVALAQVISSGRVPVDDETLKGMLRQMDKKRDFRIIRK